jgi:hypothetical protein
LRAASTSSGPGKPRGLPGLRNVSVGGSPVGADREIQFHHGSDTSETWSRSANSKKYG